MKFDFDGGYNIYLHISPWMCGMPISSELDFFYVVRRLLKYLSKFYLSMNNEQKWFNYIMGTCISSWTLYKVLALFTNDVELVIRYSFLFYFLVSCHLPGVRYGTASILDTKVFIGLISDLCV